MKQPTTIAGAMLTCLCLPAVLHAGVYMEMIERDAGQSAARQTVRFWADGPSLLVEQTDGARRHAQILRDQQIYIIDHVKKTYMHLDRKQLEAMGDRLGEMRKQMEAQLAKLPPEQRQMVEQMMRGKMGATVDQPKLRIEASDHRGSAAGADCRFWNIWRGERLDSALCVASPAKLDGGVELMQTMKTLAAYFAGMRKAMERSGFMPPDNGFEQLENIDGLPVINQRYDALGKLQSEIRTETIRRETIATSRFTVPDGYKEERLPALPAGK
ncbi:MAG: hypothetical protein R3E77_15585 [Steroidobacteraceae bacterium]